MMMKRLILLAFAGLAATACASSVPDAPAGSQIASARQVYVIRHLQKGEGPDPSLTAEGAANARKLASLLRNRGIVAIFATQTRRAMETAAPLALVLGLQVTPYDPRDPEALSRQVAAAAGPVIVVGHSNTVPELVARFGGRRPAPLGEQDYGTLFVVDRDGSVATVDLR